MPLFIYLAKFFGIIIFFLVVLPLSQYCPTYISVICYIHGDYLHGVSKIRYKVYLKVLRY